MLMDERWLTINAISVPCDNIENILHNEIGMMNVSTRWVPRFQTPGQKHTWRITSQENLRLFKAGASHLLERFLTQDECSAQRQRDIDCSGNIPSQCRFMCRKVNGLIFFWWEDTKAIVLIGYLQKDHAINGKYYANLLRQL